MEKIIQTLSPALNARMLTSEQRAAFERGLTLLENIPQAQTFVRDSRRFKDYHRRVRHLLTYLQTTMVSTSPSLLTGGGKGGGSRRVGRPTKEEQQQYQELQRQKALDDARASLFPDLKPDTSLQPLTYNGIVANPNGESIAATMPHLLQLRPFLSEDLQKEINKVRDLRNEMASKAEQAKTMVEANERSVQSGASALYTEAEIAALATRAVEIESSILPAIYNAVDREMGEVYLRLSSRTGDPEYIKRIERQNISAKGLRTQFKPFYEKALARDPRFADMVAEKIANDRPEVKAARDAAAKHKAEADAIIKYIIRKDKPATKKRVKGLQDRIDTLRKSYSDIITEEELTGYQSILVKTIEDLEKK